MKKIVTIIALLLGTCGFAQQLVYRPVNPMFGGETFNYQQLLNSANVQNRFGDDSGSQLDRSSLGQFSESLNRQILGQLTRGIFDQQLGDGLEPGTFTFGTLSLEIFDSAEGLVVNILDISTGEQTQIIIPN